MEKTCTNNQTNAKVKGMVNAKKTKKKKTTLEHYIQFKIHKIKDIIMYFQQAERYITKIIITQG